MAADARRTNDSAATAAATAAVVKRRPTSAPKGSATMEPAAIPRIVCDDDRDGGGDDANLANNTTTTTTARSASTSNGPVVRPGGGSGGTTRPLSGFGLGGRESPPGPLEYIPHRCNSDIGLPTASMPNLTLTMNLGGGAGENGGVTGSGDKLGVYCSPRTTRRSVDLDVVGGGSRSSVSCGGGDGGGGVCGGGLGRLGSSHDAEGYEWLEEKTSSLRVLSAGSRVGSAVSLNSVCTAHSVGLLSNDSDDDFQDSSLHDGSSSVSGATFANSNNANAMLPPLPPAQQSASERAGQLRRLQSYPEEDKVGSGGGAGGAGGPGEAPRTSHSLCNLKAVQQQHDSTTLAVQGQGEGREQLTPEKLCLLPSDLDETDERVPPGGKREDWGGGRHHHRSARAEDSKKAHIVSYGKGSSSMRDGRIRRWLQDMDKDAE